jgi:hypothetical protein
MPSTSYKRECIFTGQPYDPETFNKEHFIPQWLLNKYDLHNKTQQWPGNKPIRYGKTVIVDSLKSANEKFGTIEDNIRNSKFDEIEVYLWALKIHIGLILRGSRLPKNQANPQSPTAIDISEFEQDIKIFRDMCKVWFNTGKIENHPGSVFIFDNPYPSNIFDFAHCNLSRSIFITIGNYLIYVNLFDMGYTKRNFPIKNIKDLQFTPDNAPEKPETDHQKEAEAFMDTRLLFTHLGLQTSEQSKIFVIKSEKQIIFPQQRRQYLSLNDIPLDNIDWYLKMFSLRLMGTGKNGEIYSFFNEKMTNYFSAEFPEPPGIIRYT